MTRVYQTYCMLNETKPTQFLDLHRSTYDGLLMYKFSPVLQFRILDTGFVMRPPFCRQVQSITRPRFPFPFDGNPSRSRPDADS